MKSLLDEEGAEIVRRAARTDQIGERNEFLFKFPISLLQKQIVFKLNNPRDLPILYLFSNICMLTLPAALVFFIYAPTSHIVGAVYFILNYVVFLQRFMLALHYSEHRKLFRSSKNCFCLIIFINSFQQPLPAKPVICSFISVN
jgi:ABC-type multidrug transport system fused ATPase/permease subunit